MTTSQQPPAEIEAAIREIVPDTWKLKSVHHQKLGKGERYSYRAMRNNLFSNDYECVGVFVTLRPNSPPQVVCQDEDGMTKEYEAVRHSMEAIRKDASTYFNVLITLLSGSIIGVGMGYGLTLALTGVFLFLLFVINLYFKQVLFARRLRLMELEKVLGYELLSIVAIARRTWLVNNTPYLVFVIFGLLFLVGAVGKILQWF